MSQSKGEVGLSVTAAQDVELRKRIYEKELETLASAQMDLLRNDYDLNWTLEDADLDAADVNEWLDKETDRFYKKVAES